MKTARITSILGIFLLLFAFVPAAQAGPPPGNWVSGIACQNLSDTENATIIIEFFDANTGTSVLEYSDPNPLAPGVSRNYYTPSSPPGLPTSFIGSAVVTSNTELSCSVNTQTTGTGTSSSPYRIGTSSGFNTLEASDSMYIPQVMNEFEGNWSSYIAVQNTTGGSITVDVTYRERSGAEVAAAAENITIPAYSSHVFYQNDNAGLPDGFLGAATVTSSGGADIAVTSNFYNSGTNSSTAQFHSYNGFASGANRLLVPRVVRNYYGYNSGISIQNVGMDPTSVTIDFSFAGNTYTYTSSTINPGAALAIYLPSVSVLNPVDSLAERDRFGSAVIEAADPTHEIVAIVNEDNRGGSGVPAERIGQGSTYNAILDGAQTTDVVFSQITDRAGGIFSGGFQVANTTGDAGTCDIFYNADADANETDVPLPANGSFARFGPNVTNLNDGYNASVTVECTQPVVGIFNLAATPGTGRVGDSFTQANGLNR